MIATIAWHELRRMLRSSSAWAILASVQLASALLFFYSVENFIRYQPQLLNMRHPPGVSDLIVAPLFDVLAFILLMVTPIIGMRSLSVERRDKTLTLLLSSPLSMTQVVLGKYSGMLLFLAIMIGMISLMPLSLWLGTDLDGGKLASGVLGVFLILSAFAAASLYISSLTQSPATAAVGAFFLLFGLWLISLMISGDESLNLLLKHIALLPHLEPLLRGSIRSADVIYFVLFAGVFLILTIRRLEAQLLPATTAHVIQQSVFVVLLFLVAGSLGWLSERHNVTFDATHGKRNSLTEASVNALQALHKPVDIIAFVRHADQPTHDAAQNLIARYRRHKADIKLTFIDPDLTPSLVREQGIQAEGEMLVKYGDRQEVLRNPSERHLTSLLVKLASADDSHVAFISGHGERSLRGIANYDLGNFGKQLRQRGIVLHELNLVKQPAVPRHIRILVISSPRAAFLPGELALVNDYLAQGGNLLWLTEPASDGVDGLAELAERLGISRLPGQVVDASTRLFGIDDPTFVLLADYPAHEITTVLYGQMLFPQVVGLQSDGSSAWRAAPILQTLPRSWTELGEIKGDIRYDEDTAERRGPITIGMALERQLDNSKADGATTAIQRVVIIGDGDFLSNTYLGNGQNADIGRAVFSWLNHADDFIHVGGVGAPDSQLEISQGVAIGMVLVFAIALPLALLGAGLMTYFRRRWR